MRNNPHAPKYCNVWIGEAGSDQSMTDMHASHNHGVLIHSKNKKKVNFLIYRHISLDHQRGRSL